LSNPSINIHIYQLKNFLDSLELGIQAEHRHTPPPQYSNLEQPIKENLDDQPNNFDLYTPQNQIHNHPTNRVTTSLEITLKSPE